MKKYTNNVRDMFSLHENARSRLALQHVIIYKVAALIKREARSSLKKGSEQSRSKNEKSKIVEPRPPFDMDVSVKHCCYVVRNDHPTAAAKRSAHATLLKIANFFQRTETI